MGDVIAPAWMGSLSKFIEDVEKATERAPDRYTFQAWMIPVLLGILGCEMQDESRMAKVMARVSVVEDLDKMIANYPDDVVLYTLNPIIQSTVRLR